MNFGHKNKCLYLHSASEGRKIEILRKNNRVCFEMDCRTELIKAKEPCQWGMRYYSIIGSGEARFIEDFNEKIEALDIIMQKYASDQIIQYNDQMVEILSIIFVEISELTGKMSG